MTRFTSRIAFVCIIFCSLLFVGCSASDTSSAGPVDPTQFNQVRASYLRARPGLGIGMVTAILPDQHLAAVGRTPIRDFRIGDIVTFVDSAANVLANGKVEGIEKQTVIVRYTPTQRREPMIGDLAIRDVR
jgi:hypothetical protein